MEISGGHAATGGDDWNIPKVPSVHAGHSRYREWTREDFLSRLKARRVSEWIAPTHKNSIMTCQSKKIAAWPRCRLATETLLHERRIPRCDELRTPLPRSYFELLDIVGLQLLDYLGALVLRRFIPMLGGEGEPEVSLFVVLGHASATLVQHAQAHLSVIIVLVRGRPVQLRCRRNRRNQSWTLRNTFLASVEMGVKSTLVPFFKKKRSMPGTVIPIVIGGTKDKPNFGLNVFHRDNK